MEADFICIAATPLAGRRQYELMTPSGNRITNRQMRFETHFEECREPDFSWIEGLDPNFCGEVIPQFPENTDIDCGA